jgi:hypothetical protein
MLFERNRYHIGILRAGGRGRHVSRRGPGSWPLEFNGKPFPAFGPSTFDERTAAFGRHAFEKSMGPGTFDPAGLIGSFHGLQPFMTSVIDIRK